MAADGKNCRQAPAERLGSRASQGAGLMLEAGMFIRQNGKRRRS
jgi:hypothetical protein